MKNKNLERSILKAESGSQKSINSFVQNSIEQSITGFLEKYPVVYQFLRFGSIGVLNTALNFLILNTISKALSVSEGWKFGALDTISFSIAIIQSYLWNRTWTFGGEKGVALVKNFVRLVLVGLLGFVAMVLALVGAKANAPAYYFLGLLTTYLIFETVLWRHFGFHLSDWNHESHSFIIFALVTIVGLVINVSLASVISSSLHITHSDLDKNIATILATGASLIWNFIGYKVVVFKK